MKGIIFNALESFVDQNFGEETFDRILEKNLPEISEPFVGPKTYPDQYLFSIIALILEKYQLDSEETIRQFGEFLFGLLAKKYPHFMQDFVHPKEFILTIHNVIHVEVKKLFPEAITPDFSFKELKNGSLEVTYSSPRKLYSLAEGLLIGSAKHFQTEMKIIKKVVTPQSNTCLFLLEFAA
jgi:hypothetical protein